jgi:hypothetical protein
MSRKNTLLNFQTITNGDMSLSSLTSAVTNIQRADNIGLQFNFTGSPVGTFQVQVSIDYAQDMEGNVTNPGNWIPVQLQSSPVASGSAGQIYIDLTQLSAPWIRTVYTKTSGTGTLNAFISTKMI